MMLSSETQHNVTQVAVFPFVLIHTAKLVLPKTKRNRLERWGCGAGFLLHRQCKIVGTSIYLGAAATQFTCDNVPFTCILTCPTFRSLKERKPKPLTYMVRD